MARIRKYTTLDTFSSNGNWGLPFGALITMGNLVEVQIPGYPR